MKSGIFIIDLNSIKDIDLENPEMNARLVCHLKSQDFFYTEKFHTASFEIIPVKPISANMSANEGVLVSNTEVTGNLTIRGITKSITFPARIDFEKETVSVRTTPFAINRTLWEVNYMSKSVFAEIKDQFIDDNFILSFNLRFKKD